MTKIEYKYKVNLELLRKIEEYIKENNPTTDELRTYFRRLKLFYQYGLSRID